MQLYLDVDAAHRKVQMDAFVELPVLDVNLPDLESVGLQVGHDGGDILDLRLQLLRIFD